MKARREHLPRACRPPRVAAKARQSLAAKAARGCAEGGARVSWEWTGGACASCGVGVSPVMHAGLRVPRLKTTLESRHVPLSPALGPLPALSLHALLLAACAYRPRRLPLPHRPLRLGATSDGPSAVAVVQAQVDAYNAHDLDAFVWTGVDDAVIARRRDNKILTEGKPALRETYAKVATVPHIHATIAERKLMGTTWSSTTTW